MSERRRRDQRTDQIIIEIAKGGPVLAALRIQELEAELSAERAVQAAQMRDRKVMKEKLARVEEWLNSNTTHYLTSESEAPVLAGVCERIWYHATDDTDSYPFTDVIYKALEKDDDPTPSKVQGHGTG